MTLYLRQVVEEVVPEVREVGRVKREGERPLVAFRSQGKTVTCTRRFFSANEYRRISPQNLYAFTKKRRQYKNKILT